MKSRETRPQILDRHFKQREGIILAIDRYYRSKTDEELRLIRAELTREQQMLGNIPLLASTTPIVFLIFGSQVNQYFPHTSIRWKVAVVLSVLIIVWSINHHFRKRGRVYLDLYLIEQIEKERSKTAQTPVE
ncbi:hypothetical protein OS242_02820 [Tumebacillus sp. DT12]|uniref:Uncharacterized protein n=1 Tax=Tumebacillus lacus TaxID=2995335 RepID=A0ABT3WW40_9BACL|nr:hypothetical protein [Tumebacillus lacus]MCX7568893.1 hypothetical protein [Tumebacillus lacus]